MELLEGRDLEAHLTEIEARGGRAEPRWVEQTFAPIVSTLATAHSRGLVHRDLKAENIFLLSEAKGGGVRLLDFGFVKLMRAPSITANETIAGSPAYIAPETWLNGAAYADERADIYSLAVMLFRAIAGRLPFRGDTLVELMVNVTTGPREKLSPLLPAYSPDIDAWVQQALAIDRDQRFSSTNAVFRALCACMPPP